MPVSLTATALSALYLALYLRNTFAKQQANESHQLMNEIVSGAQDLILIVDTQANILFVNDAWLNTLGYSKNEASRMNMFDVMSDNCKGSCKEQMQALLHGQGKGCFEVTFTTKDKQQLIMEGSCHCTFKNSKPHMIRGIFRDISHRREQDKKLLKMAFYDMLTNLPNRYLLNDRLAQAIHQARRYNQQTAIVYIDLDKFKKINDTYGHTIGDHILQKCSRRLQDCLRDNDTIARIGGDEFLLILTGIKIKTDIPHIIEKVQTALSAPYVINTLRLNMTASLGTAIYPIDTLNIKDLQIKADAAMYLAKQNGGNCHFFYSEETPPVAQPIKQLRIV
jgi:diguanylate cyclase (GGDEF)-like protein/PAS domain S-box-containing protein